MPHPFTMCKRFEPRVGDIYTYVIDIDPFQQGIYVPYILNVDNSIPNNFKPSMDYDTRSISRIFLQVYKVGESVVSLCPTNRPGNSIQYSNKALKALTNRGVINLTLLCKKYDLHFDNTLAMLQSKDYELQSLACGIIEGCITGKWNKSKSKSYGKKC